MALNVLDFSTTNTQISDEILNVPNSNPVNLLHDIFYNKTGKLVVIRTAAGGGGTLLVEGTDYDIGGIFPDASLPTSISPDVAYTTVAITNVTYQSTDLYVSYYPLADIANADWANVKAVTITATTYTVTDEEVIEADTTSNNITITLPEITSDYENTYVTIRKTAAANTVTINRSGTDTITRAGLTSVTLTSDGDFWTLFAGSSRWELVEGHETGSSWEKSYTGASFEFGDLADITGLSIASNTNYNTSTSAYSLTAGVFLASPAPIIQIEGRARTSVAVDCGLYLNRFGVSNTAFGFITRNNSNQTVADIVVLKFLARGRWYA